MMLRSVVGGLAMLMICWPTLTTAQGISSLTEKLTTLDERLANLEAGGNSTMESRLAALEQGQITLRRTAAASSRVSDYESLQASVTALEAKIDALGQSVSLQTSAQRQDVETLAMDLRNLSADLQLLSSPATSESPAAAMAISGEGGIDSYSRYMWRGQSLATASVLQPWVSLSLSEFPVSLDLWGSAALDDRQGAANLETADEVDVVLSMSQEVGGIGFDFGYTRYAFVNADDGSSDEVFVSAALPLPAAPDITAFYDFGLLDATYIVAAIHSETTLDSQDQVTAGVDIHLGLGDQVGNFGYQDAGIGGWVAVTAGGLTLQPSVHYTHTTKDLTSRQGQIWTGFSLSRAID